VPHGSDDPWKSPKGGIPSWRGPVDGPWPSIEVDGELERAEREWLHTNGTGAYAMSTVALMHTRRYHGMFVAALDPPLNRVVVLSHADTSVTTDNKNYRLSTHRFPGVAPTPGYRYLRTFAQDPLPRWTYRLGKSLLERTVALIPGMNAMVLRYAWNGPKGATLSTMPLMPLRPVGELAKEHGGMVQRVTLRPGEVEVQPLPNMPPIVFGHTGVFMGSPDWWRRFEYSEDTRRHPDYQEDMWTPGTFELTLEPGGQTHIVVALGSLPKAPPEELVNRARERLARFDPGPGHDGFVRTLSVALSSFSSEETSRPAILAGLPWHGAPLRDWLISLPAYISLPDSEPLVRRSLELALSTLHGGLLPREMAVEPVPSPDATLWAFEAVKHYLEHPKADRDFVKRVLYPKLCRAWIRLASRRSRLVWRTEEGLLCVALGRRPSSWMDARAGGDAVTPRGGLAIEHQGLWYAACRTLSHLAEESGDPDLARRAQKAADAVRNVLHGRFWCNETYYYFDCVSADGDTAEAWADPSVRPNALLALAIAPELFEPWQATAILERTERELLTPRGIRTLSSDDRAFIGHYEGTHDERERALHQGTVWPFLLGFYARARLATDFDSAEVRAELRRRVEEASVGGPILGHVSQVADGEAPHRDRGCPAQAWSAAELLRVLAVDLADPT
jgi:predicted glycogen debranching enzyme